MISTQARGAVPQPPRQLPRRAGERRLRATRRTEEAPPRPLPPPDGRDGHAVRDGRGGSGKPRAPGHDDDRAVVRGHGPGPRGPRPRRRERIGIRVRGRRGRGRGRRSIPARHPKIICCGAVRAGTWRRGAARSTPPKILGAQYPLSCQCSSFLRAPLHAVPLASSASSLRFFSAAFCSSHLQKLKASAPRVPVILGFAFSTM